MKRYIILLALGGLVSAARAQYIEKVITTPIEVYGMQYDSIDNRAFCVGDTSTVAVIGGLEDTVIALFRAPGILGPSNSVRMCYDARDNRLYWADAGGHAVRGMDAATYQLRSAIPLGMTPGVIGWNPVNNRLYCSCTDGGQYVVCVLSCATESLLAVIPVVYNVDGFAFDTRDNKVYCTEMAQQLVEVIDAESDSVVAAFSTSQPAGICYNPLLNRVYWGDSGGDSATAVDCAADTVVGRFHTGLWTSISCFNPRNNKVYFGAYATNDVTVIDCDLNQTRAILTMPGIPWNLCYDPHTNAVYSANRSANTVTVIDGAADTVVRSLPTFILSQCIAFNPIQNRVYVGSGAGWRVIVIQDSGDAAIAESRASNPRRPTTFPTIVRGVLELEAGSRHTACRAELLDITGRKAFALKPGANDVGCLAPGVYFISERSAVGDGRSAMSKVMILR